MWLALATSLAAVVVVAVVVITVYRIGKGEPLAADVSELAKPEDRDVMYMIRVLRRAGSKPGRPGRHRRDRQ